MSGNSTALKLDDYRGLIGRLSSRFLLQQSFQRGHIGPLRKDICEYSIAKDQYSLLRLTTSKIQATGLIPS
jgi:hypothetical protein